MTGWRIVQAVSAADLSEVRRLFLAYAASLNVDLSFQNFSKELEELPGDYEAPAGALLLARAGESVAGCCAMRPMEGGLCELKRLWLLPEFRGLGLGRALVLEMIVLARQAGYHAIRLDTLPGMESAIALYRSLGFVECEPYRYNPVEGALFMERNISR